MTQVHVSNDDLHFLGINILGQSDDIQITQILNLKKFLQIRLCDLYVTF